MTYQLRQIQYGGYFDIDNKKIKVTELEKETTDPNFWNREDSSDIVKELGDYKKEIESIEKLKDDLSSFKELIELDPSIVSEISFDNIEKTINELELSTKLSGKYDKNNAILELHSGAGGTEACDWVSMLLRMYERYLERNDNKITVN